MAKSNLWYPTEQMQALRPGDIIDIVSPGSTSKKEDLKKVVKLLESWKLKPRYYENMFQAHPFHSHEDDQRFEFLWRALTAQDSKAIWCLRGGYGANRLIPQLLEMKTPKNKKVLVGYSDISSLHIFFQKWKWPSVHGPLLESLISEKMSKKLVLEAKQFIFGKIPKQKFIVEAMNSRAENILEKGDSLKTTIIASNLVVLQSSLGTSYQPRLEGRLLALEEVGERGYRIDRLFEHLIQSQILKKCRGILLGDFTGGDEPDGRNFVNAAIERFAKQNQVPVFQGLAIGHGSNNRMLPCGTFSQLKIGKSSRNDKKVKFEIEVDSPFES